MSKLSIINTEIEFVPKGKTLKFKFEILFSNEYRWRITASNGDIIAASTEGYSSRKMCIENLETIGNCIEVILEELS